MSAPEKENLPIFPDITPVSMTRSQFYVLEVDDIQTEQDLQHLITLMYYHPERRFYYYQEKDGPGSKMLHEGHGTLMSDIEFFYYRHPNFERDYIQIIKHDDKYAWDWEEDVVKKGPMFMQVKLKLAEWKLREMEIQQKIQTEKASNDNPLELKPNFMGFGIDLVKAVEWFKNRMKR